MSVTCWAEAEEMRVRKARNECKERKPIVKAVGRTYKKRMTVLEAISSRGAQMGYHLAVTKDS